jgi:integrase
MDDRRDLSWEPGGFSPRAAAALAEQVPAWFGLSEGVIDFTEAPFCEVTYAYPCRPAARVWVDGLPEPMRHELLWWLWLLHGGGERVNSWTLALWVRVAVALATEPKRSVDSFVCLSVDGWMHVARRVFYERHGRLPGRTFEQTHRATIARLCTALVRASCTGEWWRADVWEPRRDPRIPVREHEPLGNARLHFAAIAQPWLREAVKWFFASALERGMLAWTSLPGYRTYLGGYFSEFLLQAGIDHPRLTDSESELRGVALAFLSHLRGRRSRRGGGPLSLVSVGLSQSAVASFYLFMADHRHEAAKALGEPRWSELSDAHARLWRAGEFVRRDRRAGPTDYIDPEALGRIVGHLDILALARDQTKTVVVDGERREISGRGDPQAMRAFLLEVLTGRRINEILLMEPEPLSPLPGIDADAEHDPDAFVARLRYRQSKIAGAPDTILVEREVVNIIGEQQRWLREHLAGADAGSPPAPRYLFIAWQSNRLGAQPYSANTLRTLLRRLATELQIRDAHGRLIDFQRTHRMRHTRATELLNGGVPIHVVQRYLGHLSPEMTMRYADTLPKTHEREFLRFKKLGSDGRELSLDPADIYEMVQLSRHTDRILPNGVCLLPPLKRCERGNACLTCDHFATDARHLPELQAQLSETEALIERRRAQHLQRTGQQMADGNVWLEQRLAEHRSLKNITAALGAAEDGQAVRGAGVAGRAGQPTETEAAGESEERPGER